MFCSVKMHTYNTNGVNMNKVIKMLTLSLITGAFLITSAHVNAEAANDNANIEQVQVADQDALNLEDGSADNFYGIGRGWYGLGVYGLSYGLGYPGWGGYGCCGWPSWGAWGCAGQGLGYYGLGFGGLYYGGCL